MVDNLDNILRLDQQICFPLYAASNLMTRLYRPLLANLRLTYPQYLVMMILWEVSPIPMGELCQRLYLDSGTLTPLLKRLSSTGYVSRDRDLLDERRRMISLTPAGTALKAEARKVPISLLSGFDGVPADLDLLRAAISQMVRELAKQVEQLSPKA